jgi:MscS family membrane protein
MNPPCRLFASREQVLAAVGRIARVVLAAALSMVVSGAIAQQHPLKPPDRSSPRATLTTFLESSDAMATDLVNEYMPNPTRARFYKLIDRFRVARDCLDLSEVPPAVREKTSRSAALALYEVLKRIPLPPLEEIPDAAQAKASGPVRWVIPNTEIALVRVERGPRAGEFLFSPDTVARAAEFRARVRALPYARPVPVERLYDIVVTGGGWMIPYTWIQAMPRFLVTPIAEQAVWKWIGLALALLVYGLFLWIAYRVSHVASEQRPFLRALAQFALPTSVLLATPAFAYFALAQLYLIDSVGSAVQVTASTVVFLAAAWMAWRLAPVVAEAIIATPHIAPESVDAHLIRLSARLLGIVGSMALLAAGADRLGVPVYGIVAGLGVGGLAIALAAQPTVENLLGGLSLFADRPVRVGEFFKYGDALGTVEAIGIRSTSIRGVDRTLTTIPNAALARMPIVNFTRRDQMLIQNIIGVRYETTPQQLRYVLVKLREMLVGQPRVDPKSARARFVGFGDSSLNIEVFAYVMTSDWVEFLEIREDILLRMMGVVEQAGASIAFPSQTLYLGRDRAPEESKVQAAEAAVRQWLDEGTLPFPNFSAEQLRQIRGSIAYPPPGTTAASAAGEDKK